MDSGIVKKENDEIEENIDHCGKKDQPELDIDAQIEIFASVLIEILLKDFT